MKEVKHGYLGLEIYRDIVRESRNGAFMLIQAVRMSGNDLFTVSAGARVIGVARSLRLASDLARSPAAFEDRIPGEVHPHYRYEMEMPEGGYERELRLSFNLHELGLEPVCIYRDEEDRLVALMKPVGM